MLEELKKFLVPKISIKRIARETTRGGIAMLILFGGGAIIGFFWSIIGGLFFLIFFDMIWEEKK